MKDAFVHLGSNLWNCFLSGYSSLLGFFVLTAPKESCGFFCSLKNVLDGKWKH